MTKKVVLGGGCFWGLQDLIRKQPGVVKTKSGYAGGKVKNPTYENHDGHAGDTNTITMVGVIMAVGAVLFTDWDLLEL